MKIGTSKEKFLYELSAMYDAEQRFRDGQQQILQYARHEGLRFLVNNHIAETEEHITKLRHIFAVVGHSPRLMPCEIVRCFNSEIKRVVRQTSDNGPLLDSLLACAQTKLTYFEIACYRSLLASARSNGSEEITHLLSCMLQDEEDTVRQVEAIMPELLERVRRVESCSSLN
jgi:ferritin-like metal-binding protein YciE